MCADVHGHPRLPVGLLSRLFCFPMRTPRLGMRLPSRCECSCRPSSLHHASSERLWHLLMLIKHELSPSSPFSSAFPSTSTSSLCILLAVPLPFLCLICLSSAALCPCRARRCSSPFAVEGAWVPAPSCECQVEEGSREGFHRAARSGSTVLCCS